MRIGIFGGSFDPVHFGHLLIADTFREEFTLDELRLVPSATSPLKPHGPVASNQDRIAMLRLAVAGTAMTIDTQEIDRGGVSYTIDTVSAIRSTYPDGELFLLLGADLLDELDSWKSPERIFQIATPVVTNRGGYTMSLEKLDAMANHSWFQAKVLSVPQIELSSSDIRDRVCRGKSLDFRMPDAVAQYIHDNKLYRCG